MIPARRICLFLLPSLLTTCAALPETVSVGVSQAFAGSQGTALVTTATFRIQPAPVAKVADRTPLSQR